MFKERKKRGKRVVAQTLSDDIGTDVTVVVLASPDKAARGFEGIGNHVVNQSVFIPDLGCLELALVGALLRRKGVKNELCVALRGGRGKRRGWIEEKNERC